MKLVAKKLFAVLLAVVMIAGSLAGCSKKEAKQDSTTIDTEQQTSTEDKKEEVKVEKIRVWTDNAHEKELRLKQIEEFNNTIGKEKGIEIEYTVYGTNYQDAIKVAAQAGEAPELFRPTGAFLLDFVNSDFLVPITDLPGGEEVVAPYKDQLVNNLNVFNGKTYTLPYNLTTYKFIVNDDLFAKAGIKEYPKTWDEVRKDAKIITDAGKGNEFGWVLALQSNWTISSYITRPNAVNTGHIGFNHKTMQFDYSAFAPAIESIYGMEKDGSVFPGSEGLDADAARAQFAEGRVGMIVGASFDTGVYNEQFPAKCNWSVVPMPAFTEAGSPYKEFADATSLLGIGKAAMEHPEKTLEVLKFFYDDNYMSQMYEQSLYIPYREEAIKLAKSEPTQKGFKEFADLPQKALMLPTPDTAVTPEGEAYRETIIKIFAGGYGDDVKGALADLDKRYNTALAQLDPEYVKTFAQTDEVIENFKRVK
jgi:multiple sugar transport system substrate-binding protein